MTKFSLRQAAEHVGANKSTILRAIQKGRLSADRGDNGRYAIDPAELYRVYGDHAAQRSSTVAEGHDAPPVEIAVLQGKIDEMQEQINLLSQQVVDLQSQVASARQVQVQTAQNLMYSRRRGIFGWLKS